jgi:hypothetical protein
MDPALPSLKPEAIETLKAIRDAGAWAKKPRVVARIGEDAPRLTRQLHRYAADARRLVEAAERPMAVAVFGESQVGKSHLVSVLARKGEHFLADFDGLAEPVNYIERINPDKGKEATGLVTRFTLGRTPTPSGYPVHVRLFDHADIIKIIANAYFFDGNPSRYETWPSVEEVNAHVAEFRSPGTVPVDNGLSAEDVWDIEQYLQRYLAESELTKRLKDAEFWAVAAEVVPFLSVERLSRLFSILWGRHQALSDLHGRLVTSLRQLGFPAEAFLPLSAIDLLAEGNVSVLDVECMQDLGAPLGASIEMRTAAGASCLVPRPVVAALIAELIIRLVDKPWDWFEHTDVLDFPGYRSRGLTARDVDEEDDKALVGLARALADHPSNTIATLMLRGKVEYLFQRYVADQEITAMLLCAKESNQNVRQLPEVVMRWVAATHGARPEQRVGRPTLLFFVFTRFDLHFEQKASDAQGLDARFVGRMDASLITPHGATPDTWVRNWAGGQPFRNSFLMRNPNVYADFMEIDNGREIAIKAEKLDWVRKLRAAFLSTPTVLEHFEDAGRAFDEMLKLNDGGAGYIAESLAKVCVPTMKRRQVAERLTALRRDVVRNLAPFHVATDIARRIEERIEVADRVLDELGLADQNGRVGTLIQSFMIDAARLADHLYSAEFAMPDRDEAAPALSVAAPQPVSLRARPGRSLPQTAAPSAGPVQPALAVSRRRANATLEAWVMNIHDRAQHAGLSQECHVSNTALREIATDLAIAARRLRLADRLAALIEAESFPGDPRDLQIDKATIAAERIVNGFVADWGMSWRAEDKRPAVPDPTGGEARPVFAEKPVAYDTAGIGAEPAPFETRAVDDWLFAYYRAVEENAASEDGLDVDPALNAEIGALVDKLKSST